MADRFASMRGLRFLLFEVVGADDLSALPYYAEHDRETFELMLETARRMAEDILFPALRDMDRQPPELVDGKVKASPVAGRFLAEAGEGGWVGAGFPAEAGGLQLPTVVNIACRFLFNAANFPAAVYLMLTAGAAHLILSFGGEELQETYLPPMLAGRWQGTMALTEPQAGSSLSDVAVSARPTEAGYYLISGQKVFISAGDHDQAENVVHLMLARIKGAPAGVKGISLFVVPKLRPEGGGLVPNDLNTAGIFHKLGYRGCPSVQLAMGEEGDCRGWLVGEPHRGLAYMFQMMNEARIGVGNQAAAVASAAYQASLQYARERLQGRPPGDKDPTRPPVPIIRHADVRRMLLFQRAVVEGGLSLILQAAKYADLAEHAEGEQRQRAALLLDLLTPVVKSFPSEMGQASVSAGLQILGGYGYTDEFPLEQLLRDMRIHPIHEGTTGIQGMDLLGRKVMMNEGRALAEFERQVRADIKAARGDDTLAECAGRLEEALGLLLAATEAKRAVAARGEVERFLADATLYLELFGLVAVGWQWLLQGGAAQRGLAAGPGPAGAAFYRGKLQVMRYFFHYELPRAAGLARRLGEDDGLTAAMDEGLFED